MRNKLLLLFIYLGLVAVGIAMGACVKVFMERGVPVINGGGELLLLLAVPISLGVGFGLGIKNKKSRRDGD